MKIWQVDKSCMVRGLKITPGEHKIVDWRNEGFYIEVYGDKIFISTEQSIADGKVRIKMN